MAHVALATCPTRACHNRCHADFRIKQSLVRMHFSVNHIQLELLSGCQQRQPNAIYWYGDLLFDTL